MKKFIAVAVIILTFALVQVFFFSKKAPTTPSLPEAPNSEEQKISKETNYEAGFAIFTRGTFRGFNFPMYQNRSEEVYIEASNPNIVHVKKMGTTWNDFFKTLPMELTKECLITGTKEKFCSNEKEKLSFYLNQVETPNLLDSEIRNGDRVLITYGSSSLEEIKKQYQRITSF